MNQAKRTELKANWHWKERSPSADISAELDAGGWTACAQFPSEVHVELLCAGQTSDPYVGFNEHDVQCM